MATAIKSPSNHYDTLEISPSASDAEIARAFALQMRVFKLRPDNPLVHMARLNAAYQTLRDPLKRKAYDSSIGVGRQVEPWTPQDRSAIAPVQWLDRSGESVFTVAKKSEDQPRSEPSRDMRFATFIAESLRQPAKEPEPQVVSEQSPDPAPAYEPEAADKPHLFNALEQIESDRAQRSAARNRAILAASVVGLGVLGIALGVSQFHASPAAEQSPQSAVTVPLPPATPADQASASPGAPPQPAPVPRPEQQSRTQPTAPVKTPATAAPSGAAQPEESASPNPAPQSSPVESAPAPTEAQPAPPDATEPAVNAAPVVAAAGKMPLPNATIARTIEHIGYACGQVVSTTPSDAPNVYKITCSSGDSYQATPVRGRYHFRRLSSH